MSKITVTTLNAAPITTRHFLLRRARVKKIALQISFFSVLLEVCQADRMVKHVEPEI